MTDLKISQFVDGGPVQETDQIAAVRSGVNTKVFVGSMAAEDADDYTPTGDLGALAFANSVNAADIGPGTAAIDISGNAATASTAASATTAGFATSAGNANTVTTNANLTGVITSVGNATSLGTFSSAQLRAALSDGSGTGAALFAGGNMGAATALSIDFGQGADLNYFDEGTFTPTVAGGTAAGTGASYSQRFGYFLRAGSTVWFNIYVQYTGLTGATGTFRIIGLPFTARNTASMFWSVPLTYQANLTVPSNSMASGLIPANTSYIELYSTGITGANSAVMAVDLASGFIISGFYQI